MSADIARLEMPEELKCEGERCTATLTEAKFASGTSWTPEQLASYGRNKFQAVLCMPCYRKANKQLRWTKQGRPPGSPGPRTAASVVREMETFLRVLKADVSENGPEEESSRMIEVLDRVSVRLDKIKQGMAAPDPAAPAPTVTLPVRIAT